MSVERYASPNSFLVQPCGGCGIDDNDSGTAVFLSVDYGIPGLRRPGLWLCKPCLDAIVEALKP